MAPTLLLSSLLLLTSAHAGSYRVVGGSVAAPGAWPDAAAISFGNYVGCTGVLVAPDVVLTAGHCAGGIRRVYLNTTDYAVSTGVSVKVAHEYEYPSSWGTYDITALVLETPVTTIAPRMIAQDCILDDYLYDGAPVAIVGFGMIDEWGNVDTTQLHEAFTTVSDSDCSDLSSGCFRAVSPGGELGAGGSGIDSCYGDSGGPLYLRTPEGDFLVGLTSRSYDGVYKPCAEGGIYVRPDAVIDWIESVTGRTLPGPSCDGLPPENHPPAPTASEITVWQGETAYTQVMANDPDGWQVHSFTVLQAPRHGLATLSPNGVVQFDADATFAGDDELVVQVTDNAQTPLSATVTIPVTVLGEMVDTGDPSDTGDPNGLDEDGGLRAGGCGCDGTGGSPAGLAILLGLVGLGVRRRR